MNVCNEKIKKQEKPITYLQNDEIHSGHGVVIHNFKSNDKDPRTPLKTICMGSCTNRKEISFPHKFRTFPSG